MANGLDINIREHGNSMRLNNSSLRVRLLIAVVVSTLVISMVVMGVEYRSQHKIHLNQTLASLEEQAQALQVARKHLQGSDVFGEYVDAFCSQMNTHISPGHHILVLDPNDNVIARSRYHSGQGVEHALLAFSGESAVLPVLGHRLAQYRLTGSDGITLVLAQYLDHMETILRDQLLGRGLSLIFIAVAMVVCIWWTVNHWVMKPIDDLIRPVKLWATQDFSARAPLTGPVDFHVLAREFNLMADQLANHESRHISEMKQATSIQTSLLPRLPSKSRGLKIATEYRPAAHVAGDLYDVFGLPGEKTAIAIIDVSGHGISAALLTGVVKMAMHHRLTETEDLSQAMYKINEDLFAYIPEGYFVTACVGVWNPTDNSWTYCGAGHPGGLLLTADSIKSLPSTGSLMGIPSVNSFPVNRIQLVKGQRLFLYTDGLVEIDVGVGQFGSKRLTSLIAQTRNMDLDQQTSKILSHITHLSDCEPKDDITILALEIQT